MALNVRKFPLHRRGRVLDRSRVLYVTRRLPVGPDRFLAPGAVFDPTGIPDTRLKALFAGRFIGHDAPRAAEPVPPSTGPTASSPAVSFKATPGETVTVEQPKKRQRATPPGV